MFKSIKPSKRIQGVYILQDTDFEKEIRSSYDRSVSTGKYRIRHNGVYAKVMPWYIARALSVILEYKKQKANITKTLALYYISILRHRDLLNHGRPDFGRIDKIIAESKIWFQTYCPELEFHQYTKCLANKICQYKWIKQLHM